MFSAADWEGTVKIEVFDGDSQVGFAQVRIKDKIAEICWFEALPGYGHGKALLNKIREKHPECALEVEPMPDPLVSDMSHEEYAIFFLKNGFSFRSAGTMYWEPGMPTKNKPGPKSQRQLAEEMTPEQQRKNFGLAAEDIDPKTGEILWNGTCS